MVRAKAIAILRSIPATKASRNWRNGDTTAAISTSLFDGNAMPQLQHVCADISSNKFAHEATQATANRWRSLKNG